MDDEKQQKPPTCAFFPRVFLLEEAKIQKVADVRNHRISRVRPGEFRKAKEAVALFRELEKQSESRVCPNVEYMKSKLN